LLRLLGNQTFRITETLFLKLLAIVYLFAFGSLWPQLAGLVGANGIAPAAETMLSLHADYGWRAYWDVPSLFWLAPQDWMLKALCALGCVAALFLLGGLFVRTTALAAYILYLSLISIGQPFTGFQWDALLLEAGFLAIFAGSPLLPIAYRLLLFRLMFESGLVKLTSHDPNWRNLHALRYHFYTQPLPMPLAYYMQQAPDWLLDSMTLSVFVIELLVPFFIFPFSRRMRQIAVALLISLQLVIALTGNYTFFNLLAIALCIWGLDDECFRPFKNWRTTKPLVFARAANMLVAGLAILGVLQIFGLTPPLLYPFELSNSYGLFAVMTTSRTELIVEGSDDDVTWKAYSFYYKPGDVKRGLPVIAPLQPRLDWQMWFAALGSPRDNPWLRTMVYRLLGGQTEVLELLEPPPFRTLPHSIRIQAYTYVFTTPQQRRISGSVWQRTLLGTWLEPVSLRPKPR
jgi:lipase maturation factor 1